jgi:hypothetical protein
MSIAQHYNRIVARNIERNELTAGCGNIRDKTARARHHDGTVVRRWQECAEARLRQHPQRRHRV